MLRTIMVSLGLAAGLAFAACDSGDDGNGSSAGTFGTGGEEDDSDAEESDEESAEESSSSESESMSESAEGSSEDTGPPATTTGEDECTKADDCIGDDDCPGGGQCVGCMCIGGTDDPTDPTGDPSSSDYGPCEMGCPAGEMPLGFMGIDACFCSPTCDMATPCPAPNEGTASAMCVLTLMMGAPPSQCALVCTDTGMCPTGAECTDVGGGMICMHPTA